MRGTSGSVRSVQEIGISHVLGSPGASQHEKELPHSILRGFSSYPMSDVRIYGAVSWDNITL